MRKIRCVAVLLAVLAVASALCVPQSETELAVGAQSVASAAAALTDAHVGNLLFMMGILASTADVQVGIWGGMQELLRRFELLPMSFNVWYLLPDGNYYQVETGLAGGNLSDRDYFPRVMAGEATLGDLVVSKSTDRKSMVMTVPIERSGEIIGALGATIYLDDLSDLILSSLELPEDLVLYAHTPTGQITLHADSTLLFEIASRAGVDSSSAVTAMSPLLGWIFVLGPATD
jgi:hypothetical protein